MSKEKPSNEARAEALLVPLRPFMKSGADEWSRGMGTLIETVRRFIDSEMGYTEVDFDESLVPMPFRVLADLSRQFGLGDDGVRPDAMRLMPEEFARAVTALLASLEPALGQWLDDGEWTDERNAVCCLEMAVKECLSKPEIADGTAPRLSLSDLERVLSELRKKN